MARIALIAVSLLAVSAVVYLLMGEELGLGGGGGTDGGTFDDGGYGDDLTGDAGLAARGTRPSVEEEEAAARAAAAARAEEAKFDKSEGVFGRVVDGADQPISGAKIKLFGVTGRSLRSVDAKHEIPQGEATTDEEGEFLVGPAGPDQHLKLRAEAYGFAPTIVRVPKRGVRVDVILDIGGSLEVRVLTMEGDAVAGASVTHHDRQWNPIVTTKAETDKAGIATFPALPTGQGALVVLANGYAALKIANVGVAPNEKETRTIVVDEGVRVEGKVTGENDLPIDGANVTLRYPDFPDLAVTGPVQTDREGRFTTTASVPVNGKVMFVVDKEEYAQERMQRNVQAQSEVAIKLKRPGEALRGHVVDANNHGVGGVTVTYAWMNADTEAPETRTASDGSFELQAPSWSSRGWNLLAISDTAGIATKYVRFDKQGKPTGTIQIQLNGAGTVTGKVTDAGGAPVDGALVQAKIDIGETQKQRMPGVNGYNLRNLIENDARFNFSAVSGADGSYVLADIPVAAYRITAAFGLDRSQSEEIVIVSPGTPVAADIKLGGGGVIEGWVVDSNEQPIAGAQVSASPAGPRRGNYWWMDRPAARSQSDGRFVLRGVSDGTYNLSAWAAGYGAGTENNVDAGTADATLRMTPLGWIDGVVSVDRAPFRGTFTVTATLRNNAGDGSSRMNSRGWRNNRTEVFNTDDGRFELRGLTGGEYDIRASTKAGLIALQAARVTVAQGQGTQDVRLELSQGGTVYGRITKEATGAPIPNAYVYVQLRDQGSADQSGATSGNTRADRKGTYSISGLGSGAYNVRVWMDGGQSISAAVDVQVGTRHEVNLVERQPGAIQVTVVDESGAVIENARPNVRSSTGVVINPNWQLMRKEGLLDNEANAWHLARHTAADGINVRYHVPPGRYEVTAYKQGYVLAPEGAAWTDVRGGATSAVEVVLKKKPDGS